LLCAFLLVLTPASKLQQKSKSREMSPLTARSKSQRPTIAELVGLLLQAKTVPVLLEHRILNQSINMPSFLCIYIPLHSQR